MNQVKGLYIRIDSGIHRDIKKLALFKYTSMEKWITEAIVAKLLQEKSYLLKNEIPGFNEK